MSRVATEDPARVTGTASWAIRPAGDADAPAVAAAVAGLLVELGGTTPSREALEDETRAHVADPSLGLVLVAEERDEGPRPEGSAREGAGGEIVGVLTASWARAIQAAGRLLTIEVLWTRSDRRDRGIGAGLVEALAAVAAAEGVTRVEVGLPRESFPALPATERFYLANGFEPIGKRMRRVMAR